jgi:hypothetical protein
MTASKKTDCEHCGAVGADMFSNDGSRVCQRCFAYDQVVAGELRASQHDLGLTESGDATTLVSAAGKTWHQELGASIVLGILAATLFAYAVYAQNVLAYVAGGLITLVVLPLSVQAVRTMRFARSEVPRIVARASSAPPGQYARGHSTAREA